MNIKSMLKTSVSAIALAAAVAVPTYADVLQDFTVSYKGVSVTADKMTGGYTEVFTPTSATTFETSAYATLDAFYKNEGKTKAGVISGYNLYATFTATGEIFGSGATFQGKTGSITLYLDQNNDTELITPSTGGQQIIRNNKSDDLELASTSTFQFGSGHNFPGPAQSANGDFSLTFNDFLLTADGQKYFIAPTPFYMQFTIDGNFGVFSVPDITQPNPSTTITGAANVSFIPEPGMVGLFGIALLGLGLSRRRKAK